MNNTAIITITVKTKIVMRIRDFVSSLMSEFIIRFIISNTTNNTNIISNMRNANGREKNINNTIMRIIIQKKSILWSHFESLQI